MLARLDAELDGMAVSTEQLFMMARSLASGDQTYVAESLLPLLDAGDSWQLLQARIAERFVDEQELAEVIALIHANRDIDAYDMTAQEPAFLMLQPSLEALADTDPTLARSTWVYALAIALYEWKDRQRGGVAYDAERDGPIKLVGPDRE